MSSENERIGPADPPKAGGLNHRLVLYAIRRRPVAVAGIVALTACAVAAVWLYLPFPKVTAAVVFHVALREPSVLGSGDGGTPFASYRQAQSSLVRSRATLNSALKQPGVGDLTVVVRAEPDSLTWLDRKLVVDAKTSGSEFMRVTIEGDDGDELKVLLQAVATSYLAGVDERDNGERKRKLAKLEATQQGYRTTVEQSQKRIDDIALILGATDGVTLAILDANRNDDLRRASHDLSVARDAYALAGRELAAWDAANTPKLGDAPPPVTVPETVIERELQQDRTLAELEAALTQATTALVRAEKDLDEGAPALTRAREKVEDAKAKRDKYRIAQRATIEARLRETYREAQEQAKTNRRIDLQNKLAACGQQIQVAEERVKAANKEIEKANMYRLDLAKAKRQIEHNEQLSKEMAQQIERLRVEIGAGSRVVLHEPPHTITGLEGNRRLKFAAMAGVGVFLLGFSGLVGWEYRARRVTHADEVTAAVGVRLLGTVPPILAPGSGPQAALARTTLVEAIDTIRTLLLHSASTGRGLRTILITSAGSGEGKTSLSGHLAISLARAGFNTLLVDGDLQGPSAHALFDLPAAPGLCELLRRELDTTAAVRTTTLPGLSVLPAGTVDLAARQCLIGARWRQVRQELEGRFDFLVIDTAPLLSFSDTLLLAREADGVVLSVLLGVSHITHLAETEARLRAVGAPLTGAVVNGVWQDAHRASSRYGSAPRLTEGIAQPADAEGVR